MGGEDALWNTPESVGGLEANSREILPPTSLAETSLSSSVPSSIWSVLEGGAAQKRTAQVAFGSAEHTPSNPDHNDYILKRKKFKESAPSAAVATTVDSTSKPITKAEKYMERRRKNNVASKRSRETRKQKFTDMELQAAQLEKDNEVLRAKVEMLEKMAKEMKESLVQKLALGK